MQDLSSKNSIIVIQKWQFCLVYFIGGVMLVLFVLFRPLNHDETYYMISARSLLIEGKIPYIDFVFHQMPLMLFAYMPVCNLGIYSLFAGRILSCIFLMLTFVILSRTFFKDSDSKTKFLFTVLYWFNIFLIDWAVTIKIYSLSMLLFSTGLYFYAKFLLNPDKIKHLYPASFFFSLLVFTKLVFAFNFFFIVLFTIYIALNKKSIFSSNSAPSIKFFPVIMKIMIPILISLILPGIVFWMYLQPDLNKLYFDLYLINSMYLKFTVFSEDFKIFILFFLVPQNFIVTLLSIFSFKKIRLLSVFILLNYVLFFLLHLSSRMLIEYHVTFLPFIIVLSVLGYIKLFDESKFLFNRFSPKAVLSIIVIFYIVISPFSVYHFKQYLFNSTLPLNPVELRHFVNEVNKLEGNTALSSWEGLTVFSNKETIYKENYALSYVADLIDSTEKKKYGLLIKADYEKLVIGSVPDIIVMDATNNAFLSGMQTIIEKKYNISNQYKYITIYSRK